MKTPFLFTLSILLGMMSCQKEAITADSSTPKSTSERILEQNARAAAPKPPVVTSYLTGSSADVTTTAQGGLVLMGGSTDVDAAIAWFLQRSEVVEVM